MAASTLSPPSLERPLPINRANTAPEKMSINGHFASAGQNGHANFENGVQVVDEDKEFKYAVLEYPDLVLLMPL
jgi:hypothetical protein